MTNTQNDFVIGIDITIQDTNGIDLDTVGSWALSDETMQMIIEDIAEYMREDEDE